MKFSLPTEFVTYWRQLVQSYPRNRRMPAYRELLRRWHDGELIPGYAQEESRLTRPRGWSAANLLWLSYTPVERALFRAERAAKL
jgi:hypothetical protein